MGMAGVSFTLLCAELDCLCCDPRKVDARRGTSDSSLEVNVQCKDGQMEIGIEAASLAPMEVTTAEELEPEEVACRACAGPARTAKHSSLLVNGWQSFSFSGTLHGAVKQPRTTMPFFSSPFHAGATFPQGSAAASDRYLLISDMFGLLTLHSASTGIAAGYLGQENGFGGLAVRSSLPCEALLFSELGASLQGRLGTDWGCICGWESTAGGCSTPQDKVVQRYLNLVALHNALGPCKPPPAGWCSWYCHGPHVDEALMLSSLAELKSKGLDSGDLQLNLFQLDDGWQSAWGDWLHPHPQRFPNGLKPLVEAIKAAGLTAGLWLAPASLVAASKVAQEHPDWLLKDETGRPTSCGFTAPGLWMRALDTTHPEVQAHIRHMIHTIVHEWGFKYLKCDFLHCPALPAKRWDSKTSRAAAQATLLRIIREAAGKDVFILACGAPLGPCLGSVDAVRVSADTAPHWLPVGPDVFGTRWLFANDRTNLPSARNMVCSTMARLHAGGRLWVNDPDCLLLRSEVPIGEAQALATVSALSGGSMIFSDELSHIPQERLAILKALLPALPHAAQHVAFSWGDVPDKVMAELEPMAPCLGSWRLCGVFAWCDGRQVKELSLELPGSEDQQWHVFEFWSGAYYSARASLGLGPVEARCGRLLALRPRLDQADYLGSNIHVNQAEAHVGSVWNNAQEEETLQVATCVLRP
eukprot:s3558_g2.t1